MASSAIFNLAFLIIVSLLLTPKAMAAITCSDVGRNLTPCISYVQYGGQVPGQCCTGIQSLNSAAKTTPDRQAVCRCLTSAIKGVPVTAFNLGLAAGLPAKCNVNLPYKIDPNTNCDSIKY